MTNQATNLTTSTTTANTKKKPLINRTLILLFVFIGAFATVHMVSAANDTTSKQTYQQQLQSEVDTTSGSPIDGRNPATQTQTTLAYAASQAAGPGQQVDKPAANVVGDTSHKVDPSSVLPDTKNTGVLSGGCLIGYGIPGQQCVQVGKVQVSGQTSGAQLNLATQPLTCDPTDKQALQGIQLISTNLVNPPKASSKAACNISDLLSTTPLK
jgi:hypothetical protein